MKRKRIQSTLRTIISFLVLALLLYLIRNNLGDVYHVIIRSDLSLFLLAFFLNIIIVMTLLSVRMKLLFQSVEIDISLVESLKLNHVGNFFSNFFPTTIGGDFFKILFSSRINKKSIESTIAVLADRVFGVYALFLIAAIAVLFQIDNLPNKLLIYIIWFIFIALSMLVFIKDFVINLSVRLFEKFQYKKILDYIIHGKEVLTLFEKDTKQLVFAMLLSVITKLLTVVIVYILSISLGIEVDLGVLTWLVPVIMAISMLPSLNGLGIREGAFIYFLGPYCGNENAFALSLMYLAVYLFSDIIGGIIFVFSKEYSLNLFKKSK